MEKENYNNGYNQDNTEPKLYDDLPKEIVDMLMETHPLMGKNEQADTTSVSYAKTDVQNNDANYVDWSGGNGVPSEETMIGRRTRRYAQEDGDQQYTMRFQTIQSENDTQEGMYQTQMVYDNQEGMYHTQRIDFTPQYSPHQQQYDNDYDNTYQQQPEYYNEVSQNTNYNTYQDAYQNSYQGGYQQEQHTQNGYENREQKSYDMSQSTERKGPLMQEIEITLPSHGAREENMDMDMRENRRNRRNNYDDYDLTRGAKQMDLDELYSDDYDDEESISFRPGKKLSIVFSIIVIALIGFLGFRCISLGSKLKEAQKTIAEQEDLSARYETLEMDKLKLEEEIKTLKGGGTTPAAEGEGNTQQNNGENSSSSETNGDDPGNFDWYTVTESDNSWWTLAQRFYGDGTQYTRILEANGKTESDYLRAGDKLKIPKK